jgi:hypothetical protein
MTVNSLFSSCNPDPEELRIRPDHDDKNNSKAGIVPDIRTGETGNTGLVFLSVNMFNTPPAERRT